MKEPEKTMVCPFRTEEHYEYVNMDESAIVVDTRTETFPKCYGLECPLYKYDVSEGGFYCAQAQLLVNPEAEEDD